LRHFGARALPIPTDVADAKAVDAAADRIERELGPIGTAGTYLGQVHGTMAALRYIRPRNRGLIVGVGAALAYRSVPLQSIYCGAKFAIRGFLDALRSEL
jgi:NAD(P)-dependent dehydrogenase (short-subunit alcohol dehydrogenase family)